MEGVRGDAGRPAFYRSQEQNPTIPHKEKREHGKHLLSAIKTMFAEYLLWAGDTQINE